MRTTLLFCLGVLNYFVLQFLYVRLALVEPGYAFIWLKGVKPFSGWNGKPFEYLDKFE